MALSVNSKKRFTSISIKKKNNFLNNKKIFIILLMLDFITYLKNY